MSGWWTTIALWSNSRWFILNGVGCIARTSYNKRSLEVSQKIQYFCASLLRSCEGDWNSVFRNKSIQAVLWQTLRFPSIRLYFWPLCLIKKTAALSQPLFDVGKHELRKFIEASLPENEQTRAEQVPIPANSAAQM